MQNSKILGYLGIDQHGQHYTIKQHPRKELLAQLDRKHAAKMFCDTKSGQTKHKGYVIAGLWIDVFTVSEWKSAI